ncbi:phosphoglycolate phosphatase [Enterococcus pseudoavium]|nr:phosphoglycolate phosphatase [Enterococcus pseudoavium]
MNYIWDFDGTLYDTYPIMMDALMQTFQEIGMKPDPEVVYRKIKTESIRQMILDWQLPEPLFDQTYHDYEGQQNKASAPFAETKETLSRLQAKGGRHFILTHRTVDSTWQMLKRDALDPWIEEIVGSDSHYPRKPDPAAINYFIEKYQLDPAQTVMIGDRKLDIEAGNNAGVKTCFFDLDYFKQDIQSTYYINNLKELVQIF